MRGTYCTDNLQILLLFIMRITFQIHATVTSTQSILNIVLKIRKVDSFYNLYTQTKLKEKNAYKSLRKEN